MDEDEDEEVDALDVPELEDEVPLPVEKPAGVSLKTKLRPVFTSWPVILKREKGEKEKERRKGEKKKKPGKWAFREGNRTKSPRD